MPSLVQEEKKQRKRKKVSHKLKGFIPVSIPFSALEKEKTEFANEDISSFLPSDEGKACFDAEESIEFEKLLLTVLTHLSETEKIVFLYQLLRDQGFQIDHGSFAKTLSLSRIKYMNVLKDVQIRVLLLVKGYNTLRNK